MGLDVKYKSMLSAGSILTTFPHLYSTRYYAHFIFICLLTFGLQSCFFEESSNRIGRLTGISSTDNGLGINENGVHLLAACLCQGSASVDGKAACKSVCPQNLGGSKAFVKVGLGKDYIKFKDIKSLCKRAEFKCEGQLNEEGAGADQARVVPITTQNTPIQDYISLDLDLSEGQLSQPLSFELLFGSNKSVKPISLSLDAGDGKVTDLTKTHRYQCYEYFPVISSTNEEAQTSDCIKGPFVEYFIYSYSNEFSIPSLELGTRKLVCYSRTTPVVIDPSTVSGSCQDPLKGETDQAGLARLNNSEAMTLWSLSDGDFQTVLTDQGQGQTTTSFLIEDKIRNYRAIFSNQKKENVALTKVFQSLEAPLKPNIHYLNNYGLSNEYLSIGAYLLPVPLTQGTVTSYGCPTKEQLNSTAASPLVKAIATSMSALDTNTLTSASKPVVSFGTEPFFVACSNAEGPITISAEEGAPKLQPPHRVTFFGLRELSKLSGLTPDNLLKALESTNAQVSIKFKEPGLKTLGVGATERTFKIIHPYDYFNGITSSCTPKDNSVTRTQAISSLRTSRFRYMMLGCAPITQ